MLTPGQIITLDIERPVAGGRMLARHDGQVVLVEGAIPGERVSVRVGSADKSLAQAEVVDVLQASPDRRAAGDWSCGGRDYAHIEYERQRALKGEIVADAFRRLARTTLAAPPEVMPSPEHGYRLRARLHASNGRLGFFRKRSHALCDAGVTGQLSAGTATWIAQAELLLPAAAVSAIAEVDIAENVPETERTAHIVIRSHVDRSTWAPLAERLTGLSVTAQSREAVYLAGTATVTDRLPVTTAHDAPGVTLSRHTTAFFQANRFLLAAFAQHVVGLVAGGPVLDLYAGVGLFGLAAAAAGHSAVTLVEGDRTSGADLETNAAAFGGQVRVVRRSVEEALRGRLSGFATSIVDPPATGLSRDARAGLLRVGSARIIYVSCDVATLARDARALMDGGYALTAIRAFDMFPSTAHVETVAVLDRI
jgi:23S rRNA (uracil1939-C5)-methyltransferase